ncbi:hypothetical protein CF327_g7620 [Tilletia walkeri]|nr:hypothetical protein CF327_g7620 [Tilletia walkeri]
MPQNLSQQRARTDRAAILQKVLAESTIEFVIVPIISSSSLVLEGSCISSSRRCLDVVEECFDGPSPRMGAAVDAEVDLALPQVDDCIGVGFDGAVSYGLLLCRRSGLTRPLGGTPHLLMSQE